MIVVRQSWIEDMNAGKQIPPLVVNKFCMGPPTRLPKLVKEATQQKLRD